VTPPTTLFFGDRVARVRDPVGNLWWLQSHVEDVTAEEMARRAAQPDQTIMNGFEASLDRAMREVAGRA
jgi:hypothetical protein